METFEIEGHTGKSILLVGEKLQNVANHVPTKDAIIITDHNLWNAYQGEFPPWRVIKIRAGESEKTLDTAEYIYDELLKMEADRSTFIVGIGGGVVCDIAGFVASTYMRGIRFGFVATTLLSQVDASVGGKNGVNLKGYKNIVGVFKQPEFVICDAALLKTLPKKEILCGFGEVVKHAALGDADLFTFLEESYDKALGLDTGAIERCVRDSIALKSAIVNQDETETGVRRKLNLGHTFGHAFEKITDLTHGEAVGAGVMVAAKLSRKRGLLSNEAAGRIERLLINLNLPKHVSADAPAVMDAIRRDKKKSGDAIHFVFLDGIGSAVVEKIAIENLEQDVKDFL